MALNPLAMPSKVNTRKRRSSSLHRLDVNVTARPISDSPRLQHQPAVKRKMFNLPKIHLKKEIRTKNFDLFYILSTKFIRHFIYQVLLLKYTNCATEKILFFNC